MALTKKTTILFPPELHEQLARLSEARGTSIGELVRQAVRCQYALVDREARQQAAARLADLTLPVGDVDDLIAESVPTADDLMP